LQFSARRIAWSSKNLIALGVVTKSYKKQKVIKLSASGFYPVRGSHINAIKSALSTGLLFKEPLW
jgi:hypothetical protein